jgi:hypothetical protein
MLVLFAVWGISRVMSVRSANAPRATAPSISDVLAGTAPAQEVTVIPAQASPQVATAASTLLADVATLDPNVNVHVDLAAAGRTYMRVTVDGKVQFEGRSEPGTKYSYFAAQQVEILVGNGAALQVTHNGHDLGFMGSFGEVLDRLYTSAGVITPTATLPPTRTPTPKVTATPSPTSTPAPSVTLTPKAGG